MRPADVIFFVVTIAIAMTLFAVVSTRFATYRRHRRLGVRDPLPFAGGLGAFLDDIDRSPRAFAAAAVILLAVAGLAVLAQSNFGREATDRGTGWAHDLALVEAVRAGDDPGALAANLGELSFAPSGSHRLVAAVSRATGASPPVAMQALTALLVVAGAAVAAVRIALFAGESPRARVAAAAVAVVGLVALDRFRLGLADTADLFPQLFGAVLAATGYLLLVLFRDRTRYAAPAALLFGCGVLPYVDGIAAGWSVLAAWLLLVSSRRGGLPRPLARWPVFAVVAAAAGAGGLAANPAFRSYLDLAANNGSFEFAVPFSDYSTNLSENPRVLWAIPGAALAVVLVAAFAADFRPSPGRLRAAMPWLAGFVAALTLFGVSGLVEQYTGELSHSVMARQLYVLTLEGVVAASALAALATVRVPKPHGRHARRVRATSVPHLRPAPSLAALAVAVLLVFAQWPFLHYTHSQSPLVALRSGLAGHAGDASLANAESRPYPQFALQPAENYYLATGVLRIPRDDRTDAWLAAGTSGAANVPAAWVARALPTFDGRTMTFKAGGDAPRFQAGGWSVAEDFGTWTEGNRAELRWRWLQRPDGMLLTVRGAAYVSEAHPQQRVDLFVNGVRVDSWLFRFGEEVVTRRAVVPPQVVALADSADVRFELPDAISGVSLGASEDSRVLGLAIHELTVDPLPRYDGREVTLGAESTWLTMLWDGWSVPEAAGTWTDGRVVRLGWRNLLRPGAAATFTFEADPYLADAHPALTARVIVNGQQVATWEFTQGTEPNAVFTVPASVLSLSPVTEVRLEFDNPASPNALGLGPDQRQLGLFLRSVSAVTAP